MISACLFSLVFFVVFEVLWESLGRGGKVNFVPAVVSLREWPPSV